MKVTQMPPVHAANLVVNSGNTAYVVDVIGYTTGKLILNCTRHCHGAPTGARNSSLGHPNMAQASLGKNFPKVIPSLLHVFNGWYLQRLVIWCVSLSRPQNIWCKRRHITRWRGDISSRDARISTFVQLLDTLISFQGCPKLEKDARISPTSSRIDARVSKENSQSGIILKCVYPERAVVFCGCHFQRLLTASYGHALWVYLSESESSVCTLLPKHLDQMSDVITRMLIKFRE